MTHLTLPRSFPLHALSLPRNLTACPYFCSFVINWSPCLTTSWYCLFLSSGLLVSITPLPLTRSIVQGIRPAAMNRARSLVTCQYTKLWRKGWIASFLPIKEVYRDAKVVGHALQANHTVALEELLVSTQAHLANEPALVLVKITILVKPLLFYRS